MRLGIDEFLGLADTLEGQAEVVRFAGYGIVDSFDDLSELQKIDVDDANPNIDSIAKAIVNRRQGDHPFYTDDEVNVMAEGIKLGLMIGKSIELTRVPGIPARLQSSSSDT